MDNKEFIVGLMPSNRFGLLMRCLKTLSKQEKCFPMLVLTQEFTQAQRKQIEKEAPCFVKFVHLDEKVVPASDGTRNKLFELAPDAYFYYLFDDDFVFNTNALAEIRAIAAKVIDTSIGAVFLNSHWTKQWYNQGSKCDVDGIYHIKEFQRIATRSGIIVRKDALEQSQFIHPRIELWFELYLAIMIFINGYDLVMSHVNVEHLMDEQTSLSASFKRDLRMFRKTNSNISNRILEEMGLWQNGNLTQKAYELHDQKYIGGNQDGDKS